MCEIAPVANYPTSSAVQLSVQKLFFLVFEELSKSFEHRSRDMIVIHICRVRWSLTYLATVRLQTLLSDMRSVRRAPSESATLLGSSCCSLPTTLEAEFNKQL